MTHIFGPRETQAAAYFCPSCGSPSLELKSTTILGIPQGDAASCNACGWQGTSSQLAAAPFKHEFKDEAEIAKTISTDLRNLLAKTAGATYGRLLIKWGFLDQSPSALHLAMYLDAIAKATVRAVFETRKQIVEETVHERIGNPKTRS
jgi:predicted RNA-binding Zn-ribbon protein involved in translation (DUF1610 family)